MKHITRFALPTIMLLWLFSNGMASAVAGNSSLVLPKQRLQPAIKAAPGQTQPYHYRAETRARSKKQGNVQAGGLAWQCQGNACTISGPWPTPAVGACQALARQVGPMRSYGHAGKKLSARQLKQCNAGLGGKSPAVAAGVPGLNTGLPGSHIGLNPALQSPQTRPLPAPVAIRKAQPVKPTVAKHAKKFTPVGVGGTQPPGHRGGFALPAGSVAKVPGLNKPVTGTGGKLLPGPGVSSSPRRPLHGGFAPHGGFAGIPGAGRPVTPVPNTVPGGRPLVGCADLAIRNFTISNVNQNPSDRTYGMAFTGEIWNIGDADYVSPSVTRAPRIQVTVQGVSRPVLDGRVLTAGRLAQHRVAHFSGTLSGAEGTSLAVARELDAQLIMPSPSGECHPGNNSARVTQQAVQAAMGSPNNIPPTPEIKRYSPEAGVPAGGRATVYGRFLSHRSNNGTLYLRLAPADRCDYNASSIGVGVNSYDSTNDDFVQVRIPADTPPGRYCIAARWDWQPYRGHGRVPATTYLSGPANLVVHEASYRQAGNATVTLHAPSASSSDSSEYRQPGQVTVQVHPASSSDTAADGQICASLEPVSFVIARRTRIPDAAFGTGRRVSMYRLSLHAIVRNAGDTYRGQLGNIIIARSTPGATREIIATLAVRNLGNGRQSADDFLTQAISAVELNPPEYTMWVENTQRGDDACNDLHAQPGPVLTIPGEAVRSVLVQIQRD